MSSEREVAQVLGWGLLLVKEKSIDLQCVWRELGAYVSGEEQDIL